MADDPRLVIRVMFDPGVDNKVIPANLLEEDGVTQAKYEADYEYNEVILQRMMLEAPLYIDVIFIITLISEGQPDAFSSGPVSYNHVLGIQPVTIHKYNTDGTMKVNGIKLSYAAVKEIKRVIRENPYGSIRTVQGREENVQRVGIGLIHGDIVEVNYKQYADSY